MDEFDYVRYVAALIFVLALIGAGAFALRASGFMPVPGKSRRGSTRRLAIVETLFIDPKRRLALISRDGVEHLIVLGPQGETVIEANIQPQPEPHAEPAPTHALAALATLRAERWA